MLCYYSIPYMGKVGFVYWNDWCTQYWYKIEKLEPGGETIYKESVWLLEPMGNEGVNVTWKFTDRKYYIVA